MKTDDIEQTTLEAERDAKENITSEQAPNDNEKKQEEREQPPLRQDNMKDGDKTQKKDAVKEKKQEQEGLSSAQKIGAILLFSINPLAGFVFLMMAKNGKRFQERDNDKSKETQKNTTTENKKPGILNRMARSLKNFFGGIAQGFKHEANKKIEKKSEELTKGELERKIEPDPFQKVEEIAQEIIQEVKITRQLSHPPQTIKKMDIEIQKLSKEGLLDNISASADQAKISRSAPGSARLLRRSKSTVHRR